MPSATESFSVSPSWGFLNLEASLATLPPRFNDLIAIAKGMGSLLKHRQLRPYFNSADAIELPSKLTKRQEHLLFTVYAMLASAYLVSTHDDEELRLLPRSLAVPLYSLATRLEVPPILSYDAYVYNNFTQCRQNPARPESYAPLFTFSSPKDEEQYHAEKSFITRRVAAERIIGPCVAGMLGTLERLEKDGDSINALYFLQDMEHALGVMAGYMSLTRPEEAFDLELQRYLRPFDGVVFEGVPELQGKPQYLRGATDEQSPVMRAIEAFLGLPSGGQSNTKLEEYAVPGHRKYVEELLSHKSLRHHLSGQVRLLEAYNKVLVGLTELKGTNPGLLPNTRVGSLI